MTRINCIPVQELHDKHLLAEYRELPRIFKLARVCNDAPKKYVLGKGHVKFFYDKLYYLYKRHEKLCEEMRKRGFTVNYPTHYYVSFKDLNKAPMLWNDWQPTQEAMELNRQRIQERLEDMRNKGVI